jgi:acyl-CoA thioester hydrolase
MDIPSKENRAVNMFNCSTQIRVRYSETDQMNVVYHGNYAQYMEEMGIVMPIVELHTKFLRPAVYDDLLTIKTQLRELPKDHRIEFHHEVYNEAGKLLTIGRNVLYFLDSKTMARTIMPDALKKHLEPYFTG